MLHIVTDPDTGETALHVAVSLNYDALVQQLLELGASVTPQDKEGLTPVMTACQYGHLQSLEKLGAKGITAPGGCCLDTQGRGGSLDVAVALFLGSKSINVHLLNQEFCYNQDIFQDHLYSQDTYSVGYYCNSRYCGEAILFLEV